MERISLYFGILLASNAQIQSDLHWHAYIWLQSLKLGAVNVLQEQHFATSTGYLVYCSCQTKRFCECVQSRFTMRRCIIICIWWILQICHGPTTMASDGHNFCDLAIGFRRHCTRKAFCLLTMSLSVIRNVAYITGSTSTRGLCHQANEKVHFFSTFVHVVTILDIEVMSAHWYLGKRIHTSRWRRV